MKTRREDPNQPGKTEIKCRWCVKGFRDPDIYEMNRQSPTLSMEALMVTLQILASNQWLMHIADVEGAFLQGETLKRKNGRVFVEVTKEDCIVLGIPEGAVVELVKCVYGLSDAPRAWWESFSKTAQSLGMKQSELDPCVFLWFHENSLQGILSLHVDDMVLGGSQKFHEVLVPQLKKKYPFKHWKTKQGMFLGRNLVQQEDYSIVCDQEEYSRNVQVIKMTKDRRKQKNSPVTENERTKLRGVIGAANWLMSSTRPDIAVQAGFLQQRISKATVNDLIEANRLVGRIKDHSHLRLTIRSIPLENCMVVVSTDASWSNCEDLRSQAGYVIAVTDRRIAHGDQTQLSILRWRSYKQERHTQSTLGAELMSLARGSGSDLYWQSS